jgi:NAD(P)-dependent dehydrogenase (short-subunit alcohol dehydrogenase family)
VSKIALITGGNRGLGFETARLLAEQGITVIIAARDPERGREAAERLGQSWVQLDVTDQDSVDAAAKWVEQEYGLLDILVNNAGITIPHEQGVPSRSCLDDVRRIFETNVYGVIAVTNAMLPLLKKSASARIVNVSSELGSMGRMLVEGSPVWELNNLPYNASKAALNMVTVAYAKELWDTSIKVNAEDPGYCATEINDYAGFRTAVEGAEMAVQFAVLPDDGPTAAFYKYDGPLPW